MMILVNLLDRVTSLLLGERNLCLQVRQIPKGDGEAHFPSDRNLSFRVRWRANSIVINPHHRWNFVTGFFPLYRFKGAYRQSGNQAELSGRVVMTPFVKAFVFIWMGGVLLIWTTAIGIAGFTILEFILSMEPEPGTLARLELDASTTHRLMVAGAIVGLGPILMAFGASIVGMNRMIKRKERQRLIEFCRRFAAGNPN